MPGESKRLALGTRKIAVGVSLIVLGVVFLAGELLNINIWPFGWPIFILLPGMLILAFSLVTKGQTGEPLAICGSILTLLGFLFLYQNTTNHWQSWAYAWALVGPTAVGLGQLMYGTIADQDKLVETGRRLALTGGIIFVVGLVFFELIIGISGFALGSFGWALLLIGLGSLLIYHALRKNK